MSVQYDAMDKANRIAHESLDFYRRAVAAQRSKNGADKLRGISIPVNGKQSTATNNDRETQEKKK